METHPWASMFPFLKVSWPKGNLCLPHLAASLGDVPPLWMEDPKAPGRCFVRGFFPCCPWGLERPLWLVNILGP